MKEFPIQIDGREVVVSEGMTVLQAARKIGVSIPTLCHHEKLEPYGACRMCMVEAEVRGWTKLVVSCLYPVEKDLVVRTHSPKVDKIRKLILEYLLARAPNSEPIKVLAKEYGADPDRFEKEASFCILCGLCERYCAEVKKKHAVGFVNNGFRREIRFVPEIAAHECASCKECFPLCPTSYLQAAFVLAQAISFDTPGVPAAPAEPSAKGSP